jgi:acetolactate synthase small subunit
MPSSSSTVLLGAGLLVAAAAFYTSKSGSSSSRAITDIDDEDEFAEGDFITEDDVCKIFDRLFLEMQGVLATLSQQVQQIQQSGQVIPEKQLRQLLKAEFERALALKQQQVMEDFDVDENCLEEATWEFLQQPDGYPKVKKTVERFQKLWENVSGESVVGWIPGQETKMAEEVELLSPSRVVEVAEIYFGALTKAMADLVQNFKAQGKDLKETAVAQELHMQFSSVANDKGEEALKDMGISLAQFQKSIEVNAQDPTVGRALAMLQMQQQQALVSMGVPAM